MLKGLKEVEAALAAKHIPLYLLQGQAAATVPALCDELRACALVTDFSPLREPLAAATAVAEALDGKRPVLQVRGGRGYICVYVYVVGQRDRALLPQHRVLPSQHPQHNRPP